MPFEIRDLITISGSELNGGFGTKIVRIPDLDGDGHDEAAITAPGFDPSEFNIAGNPASVSSSTSSSTTSTTDEPDTQAPAPSGEIILLFSGPNGSFAQLPQSISALDGSQGTRLQGLGNYLGGGITVNSIRFSDHSSVILAGDPSTNRVIVIQNRSNWPAQLSLASPNENQGISVLQGPDDSRFGFSMTNTNSALCIGAPNANNQKGQTFCITTDNPAWWQRDHTATEIESASVIYNGANAFHNSGYALACVENFFDANQSALAISAPGTPDSVHFRVGNTFLIPISNHWPANTSYELNDLPIGSTRLIGNNIFDESGTNLFALQNFSANGAGAIAVGAPLADPNGDQSGEFTVILGGTHLPSTAYLGRLEQTIRFLGAQPNAHVGIAMTTLSKEDSESTPSIVISAPGALNHAGFVSILPNSTTGNITLTDTLDAAFTINGNTPGDRSGSALETFKLNQTHEILMIGAPGAHAHQGSVKIFVSKIRDIATDAPSGQPSSNSSTSTTSRTSTSTQSSTSETLTPSATPSKQPSSASSTSTTSQTLTSTSTQSSTFETLTPSTAPSKQPSSNSSTSTTSQTLTSTSTQSSTSETLTPSTAPSKQPSSASSTSTTSRTSTSTQSSTSETLTPSTAPSKQPSSNSSTSTTSQTSTSTQSSTSETLTPSTAPSKQPSSDSSTSTTSQTLTSTSTQSSTSETLTPSTAPSKQPSSASSTSTTSQTSTSTQSSTSETLTPSTAPSKQPSSASSTSTTSQTLTSTSTQSSTFETLTPSTAPSKQPSSNSSTSTTSQTLTSTSTQSSTSETLTPSTAPSKQPSSASSTSTTSRTSTSTQSSTSETLTPSTAPSKQPSSNSSTSTTSQTSTSTQSSTSETLTPSTAPSKQPSSDSSTSTTSQTLTSTSTQSSTSETLTPSTAPSKQPSSASSTSTTSQTSTSTQSSTSETLTPSTAPSKQPSSDSSTSITSRTSTSTQSSTSETLTPSATPSKQPSSTSSTSTTSQTSTSTQSSTSETLMPSIAPSKQPSSASSTSTTSQTLTSTSTQSSTSETLMPSIAPSNQPSSASSISTTSQTSTSTQSSTSETLTPSATPSKQPSSASSTSTTSQTSTSTQSSTSETLTPSATPSKQPSSASSTSTTSQTSTSRQSLTSEALTPSAAPSKQPSSDSSTSTTSRPLSSTQSSTTKTSTQSNAPSIAPSDQPSIILNTNSTPPRENQTPSTHEHTNPETSTLALIPNTSSNFNTTLISTSTTTTRPIVNIPPVITQNSFPLSQDGSTVLTLYNLNATDPQTPFLDLKIHVEYNENCDAYWSNGTRAKLFSLEDVSKHNITVKQNGSQNLPRLTLIAEDSDGAFSQPSNATIDFSNNNTPNIINVTVLFGPIVGTVIFLLLLFLIYRYRNHNKSHLDKLIENSSATENNLETDTLTSAAKKIYRSLSLAGYFYTDTSETKVDEYVKAINQVLLAYKEDINGDPTVYDINNFITNAPKAIINTICPNRGYFARLFTPSITANQIEQNKDAICRSLRQTGIGNMASRNKYIISQRSRVAPNNYVGNETFNMNNMLNQDNMPDQDNTRWASSRLTNTTTQL